MLMADYFKNCTEHINTLCGKKSQLLVSAIQELEVTNSSQIQFRILRESCEQWIVLRLGRIEVYMEYSPSWEANNSQLVKKSWAHYEIQKFITMFMTNTRSYPEPH